VVSAAAPLLCDAVPENIYTIKGANPDKPESVEWVYERLAGALRLGQGQTTCSNSLRRSMLKRVLAAIPPPETRTVRGAAVAWSEMAPGVTVKMLRVDHQAGNMTAYIRMAPGAMFGAHRHSQKEECLILEGEIFIGTHRLHAGDMHVAEAGTEHAQVSSPEGALMLVRGQLF
jgi:anti-sigma factor ChrR (cupin superfamily)